MHYGHELQFGTFITPTNDPPHTPVRLAELSEALGYDLVTFQDHPYQPRFLDTWTLLTWVAARTERIHISATCSTCRCARPPCWPAPRRASTCSRGGRFELGARRRRLLGRDRGDGRPPAHPGPGGRRARARRSTSSAASGIGDERTPLRVDGEYYRVDGAKRGPAPAHDIPIWLGAYKPRMLRLIGRKADGWLPSLALPEAGRPRRGQRDHRRGRGRGRARSARDPPPAQHRRQLRRATARRVPRRAAEQWVEQLLPLALDDGVGTFILASDDPGTIRALRRGGHARAARGGRRRARAPAASDAARASARRRARRAAPSAATASTTTRCPRRSPRGDRARRRRVRAGASTYMRGGSPGLVLRPATRRRGRRRRSAFARGTQTVPLRRPQRRPRHQRPVDQRRRHRHRPLPAERRSRCSTRRRRRVRIGAGARWKDVAAALAPHGWALSSGDYGGVGVGGLATAGGIGWLVREHGLTIDHLRAVEVVLADGVDRAGRMPRDTPTCSGRVRGAGANLGIVTVVRVRGRRGRRRRLRAVRRSTPATPPASCSVGRLGRRGAARPHQLPDHGRPRSGPAAGRRR